jgi:predicted nucleotide-binding protein (sugar kinase/HSP70/actin superfamily)
MGRIAKKGVLDGRTVYIPTMTEAGAMVTAAAFRSIGVDARPMPPSDAETIALGGRFSSGEECLPLKITLGDALKLLKNGVVAPERMALFMPSSDGPCRFGMYAPLMKTVFREEGYGDVLFVSPTCEDGYAGVGEHGQKLIRTAWRAIVASDLLRKLLFRVRPYETEKGAADVAFDLAIDLLCRAVEAPGDSARGKLARIADAVGKGRALLTAVPADYSEPRPLVGIVGEIFCRLNKFSNDSVIRKVEESGGECWISDVSEWVWYTNAAQIDGLARYRRNLSLDMFSAKLQRRVQQRDEHAILDVFGDDFAGYEEPHDIREVMEFARPYLPPEGALGEMMLSVGKTVYLHRKGVDGILDINPFSCMNGIVSEAIYPRVSRVCGELPIRVLYFDGTGMDRRYELEIFMDLVREYGTRKKTTRRFPPGMGTPDAARGAAARRAAAR